MKVVRARWMAILVSAVVLVGCAATPFGRGVSGATQSDERIAFLTRKVAERPRDLGALNDLGREYARQSAWQRSAGAHQEALFVSPGNADALVGLGGAQAALGAYEAALTHARQAGTGAGARNLEGIALAGLGQNEAAVAIYRAAFEADPRDLDTRNNLALALALGGDSAGYMVARQVAFAPGSDLRHRRNFFLVAGILGLEANARADGAALGVTAGQQDAILEIGRRARSQGVAAFGVAPRA